MSSAIVQATSHKLCEHFATEMYDEHICLSSDENGELDRDMGLYKKLGFPGTIDSTDVILIGWSRCPYTTKSVRTLTRKASLWSRTR